ncbi:MAG: hypothetical protein NTX88_05870 [Candidatus Atribacteria bacterium]|nr:hypothetical protein [Candidatus Atribacteria bacterium]
MLTMIPKDHIKYQREYQGKSLRMIAQETSYDFRTVKKYADCDNWNVISDNYITPLTTIIFPHNSGIF